MRFVSTRARTYLRTIIRLSLSLSISSAVSAADVRPLQFDDALRIAEQRSARLSAQRAAVDAVSEQVARASELPDPKLRFGLDNVPVTDSDAFSLNRDFMTMRRIGYMQDVPNTDKRQARGARAASEREVERATLSAQQAQVRQEVALAWLELYYAHENERVVGDLIGSYQLEAETTGPGVSAGRIPAAAAVAARVAVENARDRLLEQQRNVARARAVLAALLGERIERPLAGLPNTTVLAHGADALVNSIDVHPAQRIYQEREALAASEVALATSTRKPDWSWEVSFGQREPRFSNMVSVMVSMDLPLRKRERQDRDVATRVKQLEQARAQREDARRLHQAEVSGLLADWRIAGERTERFEKNVMPLVRERAELALAAYRGGRGELATVLESRRAAVDVQLSWLAAELERGRAWARLNYLLEHGATR